ncbi:amidohydrolase/deacetylase family metallohydrolase [Paenibacillus sp. 5J-6]|jgi:dihydroorotase|uniref:Amidohydrolase/deacetylase family metallohydrolase n=1 Tax=Paenibacillus silvestris TaxID=2606219 RepID=A0A6L8V552_9BACL|nr:amidohydrolase/deacetylase family metallohydrolase [Paenibacillus silvestris]MZQ85518.1 amidohydrolase/deacetylase family metallohydrolase [Paenibacillus silvestris]
MKDRILVKVIDPIHQQTYKALLNKTAGGYHLDRSAADYSTQEPEMYLSPGWIDLHTHVYDGVANLSVSADAAGIQSGVHLVVDAGSAGEATLPGLRKYVAPASQTEVMAWLNISSIGLVHLREVATLDYIDIDKTVNAVIANRDFVCGIKVRSSGAIVGAMGLQPLQLAKLAAREAGVPIMVHIGEAPPIIDSVLDLLDEGDVITHCFHGKTGNPWLMNGKPGLALQRAIDRGVKLDVGHGGASFNVEVCRHAIAAGFAPHTISTDVHIRNIRGPVYDLPTTMTKLLACGMPIEQVIAAVTSAPSQILQRNDWCSLDGNLDRATLFRLDEQGPEGRDYRDSQGNLLEPEQFIKPSAIINAGLLTFL